MAVTLNIEGQAIYNGTLAGARSFIDQYMNNIVGWNEAGSLPATQPGQLAQSSQMTAHASTGGGKKGPGRPRTRKATKPSKPAATLATGA